MAILSVVVVRFATETRLPVLDAKIVIHFLSVVDVLGTQIVTSHGTHFNRESLGIQTRTYINESPKGCVLKK